MSCHSLPSLSILSIHSNQLTSIDLSSEQFPNLKILSLRDNKLAAIKNIPLNSLHELYCDA